MNADRRTKRNARRAAGTVMVALWLLASGAAAAVPEARHERAEQLYAESLGRLETGTIEDRRQAIMRLEEATLLVPEDLRYQLKLADAYYRSGFLKNARQRYERAAALSPGDPDSHFGMAQVWRRDWLKFLDRTSLDRAIHHFTTSASGRPDVCEDWLQLVPLHVENGDLEAARAAAERALAADRERPEAGLALAYTAYRMGEIELADEEFARAVPRLHRLARERFEDIAPVASARDTFTLHRLSPEDQREFVRRFWKEHDPDLTTRENEARLEYWSRVAQAYFLFFNVRREEWDERGEVYVRYGPPESAEYNPLSQRLSVSLGYVGNYPANILVWEYPSLGMSVTMQDRLLQEFYLLPITRSYDADPMPSPEALNGDSTLATRGGRGVFPMLPPSTTRLPVHAVVARFDGEMGPRLLAQIEVAGSPDDSLYATWAVMDSTLTDVARSGRNASPSACEPTELRVADFAATLPPGRYTVGLSMRDGHRGRGVYRTEIEVDSPATEVRLSDIVVSCGPPVLSGAVVRPDPNPAGRVRTGEVLTAYFEIYGLTPGDEGQSRFEYVYTVRSAEPDDRIWLKRLFAPRTAPPPISASRTEEHTGRLRRQFVTVPVQQLAPGTYELEIRVRDDVVGRVAAARVPFERVD